MKINLVRQHDNTFIAATEDDLDKLKKVKIGDVVSADIKIYRNYMFHRKFFALINCAWGALKESQRSFFKYSVEGFRHTVILAAGFYNTIYDEGLGRWIKVPKSIAFDKMSEEEFDRLYDSVKDVLLHTFLNHLTEKIFIDQLAGF